MREKLFTTGEFADLMQTTKRTLQLYDQIGILQPKIKGENGYRYYSPEQMLDFQMVHLLTLMGVKLEEIRRSINKKKSITKAFKEVEPKIIKQVKKTEYLISTTTKYLRNLNTTKTFLDPRIINRPDLKIYYIKSNKSDSSSTSEIRKLSEILGKNLNQPIFVKMFNNKDYGLANNQKDFITGILYSTGMKNLESLKNLESIEIKSGSYYSIKHIGSPKLIDYLWNQMHLLQEKKRIKLNKNYPYNIEIYTKSSFNGYYDLYEQEVEMLMPINLN